MKKILMTLVLAPVMALAGESAAATNTCDAPHGTGSPLKGLIRPLRQQATTNGYTWTIYSRNGVATLGSSRYIRGQHNVSPKPSGHVSIPSELGGNKVIRIGDRVFWHCDELTSVMIPEGVQDIGPGAFSHCGKLSSVEIPSTVTKIMSGAFSGCGQLTSIKLPQGLKEIGFFAFKMCRNLESVTIPKSVKEIGGEAFAGCTRIKHIEVEADNPHFISIDGVVYTKDRKELVVCPGGLTSMKPLDGMTSIREGAFAGCGGLMTVELPNSVTNIGRKAFAGCPFATIALPEGLRRIENGAFWGCAGLSSITIPDSVTIIGDIAFEHCSELTSVTMLGVRPISSTNAFHKCNKLMSIHVPANSKDWAGMKDWLGVPLVFDGQPLDPQKEKGLIEAVHQESARQASEAAQLESDREYFRKRVLEIQEDVKRLRAQSSKRQDSPKSNSTDDKAK